MKMLKRQVAQILYSTVIVVLLGACTAGEAPLELTDTYEPEPEIDAATIDPCASQFAFQRELNGEPDDTAITNGTSQGKSLTTQLYWYADTQTIFAFTYAAGETWCNVSNESSVSWNY